MFFVVPKRVPDGVDDLLIRHGVEDAVAGHQHEVVVCFDDVAGDLRVCHHDAFLPPERLSFGLDVAEGPRDAESSRPHSEGACVQHDVLFFEQLQLLQLCDRLRGDHLRLGLAFEVRDSGVSRGYR